MFNFITGPSAISQENPIFPAQTVATHGTQPDHELSQLARIQNYVNLLNLTHCHLLTIRGLLEPETLTDYVVVGHMFY